MAEKKVDGRTVLEPETSPITAENWIQIRDNYQLQDLIEEKGFKLPKNVQEQLDMKRSPSGTKPAAEKPKGEAKVAKSYSITINGVTKTGLSKDYVDKKLKEYPNAIIKPE
jgi:hypothetical protein